MQQPFNFFNKTIKFTCPLVKNYIYYLAKKIKITDIKKSEN